MQAYSFLKKGGSIAYYRISILQNSILIDPTLLEISQLSMIEIFLFAVFSYCTL